MRLTKTDMARVIVAALHNMPALPPAEHPEVQSRAKRGTVEQLRHQHKLALAAIDSVVAKREAAA